MIITRIIIIIIMMIIMIIMIMIMILIIIIIIIIIRQAQLACQILSTLSHSPFGPVFSYLGQPRPQKLTPLD